MLYSRFLLIMLHTVVCMSLFQTPNLSLSTFLIGIPKFVFKVYEPVSALEMFFFFFFFRFPIKVVYALKTTAIIASQNDFFFLPIQLFHQCEGP